MQFTTTAQASIKDGVKIVLYGKSGVGKTRLASTVEAPIILSAERGLLSLADMNIPVIMLDTPDDIKSAYGWLISDPAAANFKTIYIDSISDIAEVVQRANQKVQKDLRKAIGESNQFMNEVIRNFRALSSRFDIIFTAKESNKNGVSEPAMPSSGLADSLPYFFDGVLRVTNVSDADGKSVQAIQCRGTFDALAKDRSGKLNEYEAPNLGALISKMKGQ